MELELLKQIIDRANSAERGYFEYAHIIACELPKNLHEQLNQLVNGPVWDGDVISKSDRNQLMSLGLAQRVCCKGEQGYTGATYLAYSVNKAAQDIKKGKVGA